jgi:hypothetical protein
LHITIYKVKLNSNPNSNSKPEFGGAGRDRTGDLIVANDALSQLSYSPTRGLDCRLLKYFSSDPESAPTGSAPGTGVPAHILFRETSSQIP